MKKDQLISAFVRPKITKLVFQVIRQLQQFKITFSGDDSGLENTWDEICVQIQDEYSFTWELYEETVHNLVNEAVNHLERH